MQTVRTALARTVPAVLMCLLAACGGGGGDGDGGAPSAGGGTGAPSSPQPGTPQPSADRPSGLYWSWTEELVPFTNAMGFTTFYTVFKYRFAKYFDNDLVYVGPPTPDFDSLQCSAPSTDARGNPLCATYTVSGGQITIGNNAPVSIAKAGDGWTIDGRPYKPMAPQGDLRLDGSFTSRGCYLAACSQANFVFRSDGTFTASRANTYANAMAGVLVGAGSGADLHGTYRVQGHGITLNVNGGGGGRVFFFFDYDSLQMGDDWYLKD